MLPSLSPGFFYVLETMQGTQRWALAGGAPPVSQLLKTKQPPCRSSISQHAQRRRKELGFQKWRRRARGYRRILDPLAVNIEIRRRVGRGGKMAPQSQVQPNSMEHHRPYGKSKPYPCAPEGFTHMELNSAPWCWATWRIGKSVKKPFVPFHFHTFLPSGQVNPKVPCVADHQDFTEFLSGVDTSPYRDSCFSKISLVVIHKRCWSHLHKDEEVQLRILISEVLNS